MQYVVGGVFIFALLLLALGGIVWEIKRVSSGEWVDL